MAIHVRNLLSASSAVSTGRFSAHHLILLRELFLAGRWTQSAISNPSTWDTNIVLTNTDCVVSSSTPGRVTSATGGFTGYQDYACTLIGGASDYDHNRGVYRVSQVISDNEIELRCYPPNGWVSDTGMTCRIFNWGVLSPLLDAEYVVMDPPTGNNQACLQKTGTDYNFTFYANPRGNFPSNPTNTRTYNASSSARNGVWNAYFNGSIALVYFLDDYLKDWFSFVYGELESVAPTDTYPGFFSLGLDPNTFDFGSVSPSNNLGQLDMLYDNGGIGQVSASVVNIVKPDALYNAQQQTISFCRKVKGRLQLTKPWVYVTGANGGYFRGKHPLRTTNSNNADWTPVTFDGTWRHYTKVGVLPMNGLNDPRLSLEVPVI